MNKFYDLCYFIRHLPTFIKFYITNYRHKKTGWRHYRVKLYEEIPKEFGGGYNQLTTLKLWADDEDILFKLLRDCYSDVFIKGDSMRWKEII